MNLLNIINVIVCVLFLGQGLTFLYRARNSSYHTVREEVISIAIILLSTLNMCRSLIAIVTQSYNPVPIMEYCFIGISIFQVLIGHFVLIYISGKLKGTLKD